eukprot:TRINITY_DN22825_c0_g2_i1.p1 TRINITY_DN22825_c0_g2~~TRINITY_DN22825_c0_g2_i1.p1  ORF type:complete len:671 (+),score=142.26 TRINITY_DN22825_c0_g2_i1:72-2084(+)
MAQMRALEKQKEKAAIEIATLEKLQTETRSLIQKTFDSCVKSLISSMKGGIKDQLLKELKPMLKEELDSTMKLFAEDLANSAGAAIKTEVSKAVCGGFAGVAGTGHSLDSVPAVGSADQGIPVPLKMRGKGPPTRAVLRGNFQQKRAVRAMVNKRKSLRNSSTGSNSHENDLALFRQTLKHMGDDAEPLMQRDDEDEPTDNSERNLIRRASSGGRRDIESEGPTNEPSQQAAEDLGVLQETSFLEHVLSSDVFDYAMGVCILTNAIVIGAETDYMARHVGSDLPDSFQVVDMVTMVIFLGELLLKLKVHGRGFFTDENMAWNIFDMAIVVMQLLEVVVEAFTSTELPGGFKALRLIRIVRIMRLLRLVRLIRLMRIFMELRMISSLLVDTARSLFGAIVTVVIFLYLIGVCLTEEVVRVREEIDDGILAPTPNFTDLEESFGTVDRTMLSLFQSITGGLDWSRALNILSSKVSPLLAPMFCFYIAFFTFALANVITGIFVKHSMEAAQEAQDDSMVQQINNLFNKQDGLGDITYEEYTHMIKLPEMVALFKSINIDPSEAPLLYRLLDENNDGTLDYEEFINGALRLRGPAKSLELAMFIKETGEMNRWTSRKIENMDANVELIVEKIKDLHEKVLEDSISNTRGLYSKPNLDVGMIGDMDTLIMADVDA